MRKRLSSTALAALLTISMMPTPVFADTQIEKVDPTCTESGYEIVELDDGSTVKNTLPATGHLTTADWQLVGAYSGTTQGNVIEKGYDYEKFCLICGETIATAHETEYIHLPTCTERGYTEFIDKDGEGTISKFTEPTGHTWGEWESAGFEPGYEIYERTCSVCGEKEQKKEEVKLGPALVQEIIPATCTTPEYTITLEDDVEINREETAPALGHDWGEWEVVETNSTYNEKTGVTSTYTKSERACKTCEEKDTPKEEHKMIPPEERVWYQYPTCTESGGWFHELVGVEGSKEQTSVIKAVGHNWSEWEVVEDTTSTVDGVTTSRTKKVRTCSRCKEEDYEITTSSQKYPTCTEDGYTSGSVETPDDARSFILAIPASGHEWSEWTVTKAATETSEGILTRTCKKCGEKETSAIKKLQKPTPSVTVNTPSDTNITSNTSDKPNTPTVTKKKIKVKKIAITGKKTKTIKKGKTYKLKYKITPGNATNKNVTFKSSNKKIATVSKAGKITAKKKGKCTITVTTKDGKKKAKLKVVVK